VEKRLVIFVICSALILTGHMLITRMFWPPPPAEEVAHEQAQEQPPAQPEGEKEGKKEPAEATAPDQGEAKGSTTAEAAPPDATRPGETSPPPAETPAQPSKPQAWLAIGSYAADSPFQLLIYLTNRGAAIERVELVERRPNGRLRYRDLTGEHGYLGLQCHDTADGCAIAVVGPGTPAALASCNTQTIPTGLAPADTIETIDGMTIGNQFDFLSWLEGTRSGQDVQIGVRRTVEGQTQHLAFTTTLDDRPLELVHLESPTASYLLGLNRVGKTTLAAGTDELKGFPSLRREMWEVVNITATEVTFRYRLTPQVDGATSELEFIKRFRIVPKGEASADGSVAGPTGYDVNIEIEIANRGASAQTLSYALDGPTGLPTEGWWYSTKMHPTAWSGAGARDVIWRVTGRRHSLRSAAQIYAQAQADTVDTLTSVLTDNPTPDERTLDYLGVDTQFFAAVLMSGSGDTPNSFLCQQAYAMPVGAVPQLESKRVRTLNTTFRVVSPDETIEPGKSATHKFHLYLGPKAPALLDTYGLRDIIEYGWFWWIARPLSKVLHGFYFIVRNYGLAIILLTVLVRGAMFPIGRRAALNAQKMQELAPEIKKIKEKYKNDLEKQGQAQRELWKKHNFNPLGGCWLMFLQLPIFIGLYRCLSVDIELRQAPLIPGIGWCSNLAGPDMAWYWKGILPDFLASETGWLGPYLNILPIITIVLFIWQQKMFTPPATDEQTRMQQKMMQYMMIFMGVMFFKVPAGLCIYFVASSLWGIGERKLLPPPTSATSGAPGAPPVEDAPKKQSWLDRVMQKEPPESVEDIRARRKSRR
jgi:YidC/Oxa1 family membrane protein insertase